MRFVLTFLLLTTSCCAKPRWVKPVVKLAEHLALGAGTEVAVSQTAGGARKWPAGLLAAGAVAAAKEGADAVAGRDTKKQAALHATMIFAGAAVSALAWHK